MQQYADYMVCALMHFMWKVQKRESQPETLSCPPFATCAEVSITSKLACRQVSHTMANANETPELEDQPIRVSWSATKASKQKRNSCVTL